jgi:carbon storage regulator CsrA
MFSILRGKNEAVVIDGTIIVTVLDICGDEVQIGIERPNGVSVERREVCDAVPQTADEAESSPYCCCN